MTLLQGLPLAIDQAGSYMRETGTDALEYMKLYEETWGDLMIQQHEFALQETTSASILTTWTVSFNELQKKSPDAANLLILWAFLDHQDLWYELFTPALDLDITGKRLLPDWFSRCVGSQFGFKKCTRFLIRYSFVTANVESSSFSVHSVLHRWCSYNFDKRKHEMAWLAIMVVASAAPAESVADYTLLQRRLLPHSNLLYRLIQQNILKNLSEDLEMPLISACHKFGDLYLDQDKIAEAEAMYLRAFDGREKAWGPDHTSTLNTVNNLGVLYLDQGKMAEAEAMYLRALAGYEKARGPDHTSTLSTVNNLGMLYSEQGKMAEAEAMCLRALAGKEKAWVPDHTSTLETVNNLGALYSDQSRMAEAEAMYLRALAGKEKAWGPDHTSTLSTVNNLGILYKQQDKMAEAEAMYLRALAGKEKAWGPDHTSTLDTVNNLGILYKQQGKMAEAEAMYLRALAGKEKAWGPKHTSTLSTVNNLGSLYLDQGKMAEAEAMYLRALAGQEKAKGPDHKRTLDTRYNMADWFERKAMFQDAAKHFERVVQGYTRLLGPEHPKTVDAVSRLKSCQGGGNGTSTVEDDRNDSDDAANAKVTSTLAAAQPF